MKYYAKIALFLIIILLISLLAPLWYPPFLVIKGILFIIFLAFTLAYVSNLFTRLLVSHKINKNLANVATLLLFVALVGIVISLVLPLIVTQLTSLAKLINNSSNSIVWIKSNPDLHAIYLYLEPSLSQASQYVLNILPNYFQNIVNASAKFISNTIVIFFLYIYMLFDFERILGLFKKKLGYDTKAYNFFKDLDYAFTQYIKSFMIIMVITLIEYSVIFYLIKHPEWKTLAALVTLSNFVPYFGAIIVNTIALITAIFVNQELFYKVLVCILVLPNVEGNIINPYVYKKTVKINPLITLITLLFLGGLFGIYGIILTIPSILFYQVFKKYYLKDFKQYLIDLWNL